MDEMDKRLADHVAEEAKDYDWYDKMARWYEEHECYEKACILKAIAKDEWQHHQMLMELTQSA